MLLVLIVVNLLTRLTCFQLYLKFVHFVDDKNQLTVLPHFDFNEQLFHRSITLILFKIIDDTFKEN